MNAIAWCILMGACAICLGITYAADAVCETLSLLIQPPTTMTHDEWEREIVRRSTEKSLGLDPATADPYKLSGFRRNPHDAA